MKSYTDIEQSKNLAEILPIDSSDRTIFIDKHDGHRGYDMIPCWSLAALIEQLPDDLVINGCSSVLWMGKKQVCYYRRDDDTSVFEYLSKGDNLLDAIVEMIKMLKSRNLL